MIIDIPPSGNRDWIVLAEINADCPVCTWQFTTLRVHRVRRDLSMICMECQWITTLSENDFDWDLVWLNAPVAWVLS